MRTIYRRAGRNEWHAKVKLGDGRLVELRLATDREVSVTWYRLVQAAADRRAANEPPDFAQLNKAGVPRRLWEQTGLVNPLAEQRRRSWGEHVVAYTAELRTAGRNAKYIYNADKYLHAVGEECGWRALTDANRDEFAQFIAKRRRPRTDRKKITAGAGVRTLRNIRNTLRSFLVWAVETRRVERDALEAVNVETGDVQTDRRRIRRALTDAETAKLLKAVAGTDRELLYRVALGTGLRWRELRELQWRDVRLDDRSCLTLRPEATKSKRADVVPLATDIATRLRVLHKSRPFAKPTDVVFPRMPDFDRWRDDVNAAGVTYRNGDGRIAGFHSLRVTLGTRLEQLGVPVKARMEIMRHTDPKVSYGAYADVTLLDLYGVVNSLPVCAPPADSSDAVRSGTDDLPLPKGSDTASQACHHRCRQNPVRSGPQASANVRSEHAGAVGGEISQTPCQIEKKRHPKGLGGAQKRTKERPPRVGLEPTTSLPLTLLTITT